MTLSPSSFYKRYWGTSELILDTKTEGDESEVEGTGSESEETEDEGPSLESEEASFEDQQQQAVLIEDTAADEPLGLGYRSARCRALELAEGTTHSTYEDPLDGSVHMDIECVMPPVRTPVQTLTLPKWSSGSLPVSPTSLTVPLPIAPPSLVEPVDKGYLDEIGAQLELHGGILHDHTHRLDALPPTLLEGIGRDITELYDRSAVVRNEIHS
ncbi:hypothetical protein Tco_0832864 [Tanacetum coccineum]